MSKMEKMVEKYDFFLLLGLALVLIGLIVGVYRTANQAILSQLIFAGDTTSASYRTALTTEAMTLRFLEIVPLYGLGFLKLGIGFAIATIVLNLRATGQSAREDFKNAGMKLPEFTPPFYGRNFIRFLVLGILVETVAVIIMFGWMGTGLQLIELQFAGQTNSAAYLQTAILDKTFGELAEPLEGLGVALLISGIAFGLATIITNLRMQATVMPKKLTALAEGKDIEMKMPGLLVPKTLVWTTVLGAIIVTSGLIPLAFIRVANAVTLENLKFAGDTSSAAYQSALVTETIIGLAWETWMFVGIATMLCSIAFWLLTIIKWLRAQRTNLGETVTNVTGHKVEPIEPQLGLAKLVPFFAIAGLLWMIAFFGLNIWRVVVALDVLSAQFAGNPVPEQSFILRATLGQLVRPGKANGLGLIFIGIGLALLTIVINLRFTAFMLPGSFMRIASGIKGEKTDPPMAMAMDPMSLAPKRLFYGILLGAIIIAIGTVLALVRMANTEIALSQVLAGIPDVATYQTALQTQLMLEHFIGPWAATGTGTIFFFIGKFFGSIVTFVKGRRQLISEGVQTCTYYAAEKKTAGTSSASG